MKKRISLSQLMHNDKLMMLVSLLLAILIWALVVFGPSNTQEQVISGVPISVALNDYANETLNLRITSGANATATVKVQGLRSVVSRLSASDITITADTGNVIKEGTYTLPLRVVSNGDYTIQSVVGPDGNNDTVTISCDVWREAFFSVSVETPHLTVADEQSYQLGTPIISHAAVSNGLVTVSGPRSDINRIHTVAAVVSDEAKLTESSVYTAKLEARDESGKAVETVSFVNAEDASVNVTVPVLVYREVELKPTVLNTPAGYKNASSLVSVSPSKLEIWGMPTEIDDYVALLQEQLKVDFDHLTPANMTREIYLGTTDGIQLMNGVENLSVRVNLSNVTTKTFDVAITDENFVVTGVPDGCTFTVKQTKLTVTLCGPAQALSGIKDSDIRASVSLSQVSTGLQTVRAIVSVVNENTVWACYDEESTGAEVLVSVDKSE